jgi:hypothetical protein
VALTGEKLSGESLIAGLSAQLIHIRAYSVPGRFRRIGWKLLKPNAFSLMKMDKVSDSVCLATIVMCDLLHGMSYV